MNIHPVHPWIDSSHAPVYHLAYPAHDPANVRQVAKYTTEHASLYTSLMQWTEARRRAYGFTIDLSHVCSTALSRQRAIQYMEKARMRSNPYLACCAYVAPNEETRGVLTAVFWHSPPDFLYAQFNTAAEARAWALEKTLALDVRQSRASLPR